MLVLQHFAGYKTTYSKLSNIIIDWLILMFISCSVCSSAMLGNICQHQESFYLVFSLWCDLTWNRERTCRLSTVRAVVVKLDEESCDIFDPSSVTGACIGSINSACLHSWEPVPLAKESGHELLCWNGSERGGERWPVAISGSQVPEVKYDEHVGAAQVHDVSAKFKKNTCVARTGSVQYTLVIAYSNWKNETVWHLIQRSIDPLEILEYFLYC